MLFQIQYHICCEVFEADVAFILSIKDISIDVTSVLLFSVIFIFRNVLLATY